MTFRRNIFAKMRTLMANERTLMSYYRTGFAFLGISAFVFKFYPGTFFQAASIVLVFVSVGIIAYGTWRFFRFRERIRKK